MAKFLDVFVEHGKQFAELSTKDAQWVIRNPKGAIALCVEVIAKRLGLLSLSGTVEVSATDKFVASDKFVEDTSAKAEVKIIYLGSNFQEWFLCKVEEPASESELRYYSLQDKPSVDDVPIIVTLGGEKKAETTLAQLFSLMEKQGHGETGPLLTSGYVSMNIFYILDVHKTLRSVFVEWYGGGWNINAYSAKRPGRWYAGSRVFSRNFDL